MLGRLLTDVNQPLAVVPAFVKKTDNVRVVIFTEAYRVVWKMAIKAVHEAFQKKQFCPTFDKNLGKNHCRQGKDIRNVPFKVKQQKFNQINGTGCD